MLYINQLKHPHMLYVTRANPDDPAHERGKTTTIRNAGCGLCSAIMVADRLLPYYEFTLNDAIDLSYAIPANRSRGTARTFFPAFAEKLGLRYENTDKMEDLLRCLRTGGAAVVHVGGDREGQVGLFTHGGHYMAIINEEPDGRLAILDPSYFPGKYDEEGRQGKVEVVKDVISLCAPETLDIEAQLKATPYMLFWRK